MERKAVGFAAILLSIILIESIFINVVAIEKQNKFLIWDLKGNSGEIKPKEKKAIFEQFDVANIKGVIK